MKLKEKWNAQPGHKLLSLVNIQAWTIIVLLCVWVVAEMVDRKVDFETWLSIVTGMFTAVLGGLIVFCCSRLYVYLRFYSTRFITFEADTKQVLRLSKKVTDLEYSVGEKRWEEVGTQNIVFGGSDGNLLLRGKNRKGMDSAKISFATDAQVICTGDIRTLVDYERYDKVDTKDAVFKWLFSGCKQLVVAPELPSTDLAANCYKGMFYNCTSLRTAPELPSTKLAENCYSKMFFGCTSLKQAPKLPDAGLAKNCYLKMFSECKSLSNVTLLAKKIDADCYEYLNDWLKHTSSEGTFHVNDKAEYAEWRKNKIIPKKWKVESVNTK